TRRTPRRRAIGFKLAQSASIGADSLVRIERREEMYTLTAENVVEMGTATKSNEAHLPGAKAPEPRLLVPAALHALGAQTGPTASEPSTMSTSLPEFLDAWLGAHFDDLVADRRH